MIILNYIEFIIVIAIIFKLLRFDRITALIFITIFGILIVLAAVMWPISILILPLATIFKVSNEEIETAVKIAIPIVTIFWILVYRHEIKEKWYEVFADNKFSSVQNRQRRNEDRFINFETTDSDLRKAYDSLTDELSNNIFYSVGILIFLIAVIINLFYGDIGYSLFHYLHKNDIVFQFYYDFSSIHLIWMAPVIVSMTFIYSKYYYNWAIKHIYKNFITYCKIIEASDKTVVLVRENEIKIIKNNEIILDSKIRTNHNFYLINNGEPAYAFDKEYNLSKFLKDYYQKRTTTIEKYIYRQLSDSEKNRWISLSAANGRASAQFSLGIRFDNGQGVVQDYAEAVRWYKLAAAQGHVSAQFNLGVKYDNGHGVEQDYAESMRWYKLAASQAHATALNNLGVMYGKGQGVVQDYTRAHMWFDLAAVKGDSDAVKNRDIVANKMTSQQIAEAQKLARECQARNFKNCD